MDYARHYAALVERARGRSLDCYTEKHHIVPRCLGGGHGKDNLVRLTPEEHYVAHQLLVKMHPGHRGLVFALRAMLMSGKTRSRSCNKEFGWIRRLNAETTRQALLGKPRSPETVAKMAARHRGKTVPPEAIEKTRRALTGKPKSPEHVAKVAAALRGRPGSRRGATTPPETREKQRQAALARKQKMSPDHHAKMMAGLTPEVRRMGALRAWETKRRKKEEQSNV